MVRIRLRRVGAKKQASYRVVVTDQRSPRDGRFIERLGWYNPRTDPPSFKIEEARALYWLTVGAQPSEAVARLLKKMGTFEKLERVKAGASIEEVLAEATVEPEDEAEAAAEEPEDEAEAAAEEPAEKAEAAVEEPADEAETEAEEPEDEAEAAVEEPADEVEVAAEEPEDEAKEVEEADQADVASEESGGEEEDEAA